MLSDLTKECNLSLLKIGTITGFSCIYVHVFGKFFLSCSKGCMGKGHMDLFIPNDLCLSRTTFSSFCHSKMNDLCVVPLYLKKVEGVL